jgi:pilus assembly protein CpaE
MIGTKVSVISSDKQHLQEITGLLKKDPELGDISAIEGEARALDEIGEAPDVLIINGSLAENGGLDKLERLGHLHPETAFIIVSENQSPEFLLRAMRAGVREVLPSPVPDEQFHAAIARVKKRGALLGADGKVFAFIPCKGGAGSTFLAANFGYVLAGIAGRKVAFLDLNVQFGDAVLLVAEQRPATDLAVVCREIHRLDASLLAASMINVLPNYSVLAAPEDPAHAVDVKAQHVEVILRLARKNYDYVVVDLGRSFDAVSLQALDMAHMIFPVLQLNLPFVRDAKRLLGVLRSLGYPKSKINLIVNRYQRGGEITLSDVEKTLETRVFRNFPNSYQAVAASINQGVPIAKLARNDPVSKGLYELASAVAPQTARVEGGWLSRMLGRV